MVKLHLKTPSYTNNVKPLPNITQNNITVNWMSRLPSTPIYVANPISNVTQNNITFNWTKDSLLHQ